MKKMMKSGILKKITKAVKRSRAAEAVQVFVFLLCYTAEPGCRALRFYLGTQRGKRSLTAGVCTLFLVLMSVTALQYPNGLGALALDEEGGGPSAASEESEPPPQEPPPEEPPPEEPPPQEPPPQEPPPAEPPPVDPPPVEPPDPGEGGEGEPQEPENGEEDEPEAPSGMIITAFEPLGTDVAIQMVLVDTPVEELNLPGTLEATVFSSDEEEEEQIIINNVTWQPEPIYNGIEGAYAFTAVLPEGYSLPEEDNEDEDEEKDENAVKLPVISVSVSMPVIESTPVKESMPVKESTPVTAQVVGFFSGGSGTSGDPYIIQNAADLDDVRNDLTSYFRLAGDIDVSVAPYTNWTPIGSASTPFTGSLDGAGFRITGLMVYSATTSNMGLFAQIGAGGAVRNLGLDLQGSVPPNPPGVSGVNNVGALAGTNAGTITNCYSTMSVSGNLNVGGLVGTNSGTITGCFSTGTISATGDNVGGLVGTNSGTITNCYATGSVAGRLDVGGLVGTSNGGAVQSSYARGAVSCSGSGLGSIPGGLVGYLYAGTISGSYFDTQASGTASGVGEGSATGVTGLTTAQMTAANALATMTGFGAFSKRPDGLFYIYYPEITALYGGSGTQRVASEISARGPERGPVYSIRLSARGTHTFPSAVAGYGAQTPLTVTVSNLGNMNTGLLGIGLSGRQASSFSLSVDALSDIAVESADTFTVTPNRGLSPGTYTATVTIRGDGLHASFNIRFTVTDESAVTDDSDEQDSDPEEDAAATATASDTTGGNMKTGDDSPLGFLWATMIISSFCLTGAVMTFRRLFIL